MKEEQEREEPRIGRLYLWYIAWGMRWTGLFMALIAVLVALTTKVLFGLLVGLIPLALLLYSHAISRYLRRKAEEDDDSGSNE